MRKTLFYLAFLLAGCGVNGGEPAVTPDTGQAPAQPPPQPVAQHDPEITGLVLSPTTVTYMAGAGSVVVTAEITFRDAGSDLQTLWVRMPDGATVEFDEPFAAETGTFTENLTVSTDRIGAFTMELWLVDQAGYSSEHVTADFIVAGNVQESDWTRRLSGLPYVLNDVVWDGSVFVAVGDGGAVLTSSDGIDWVARDSGTDAYLYAVAAHGPDIFAVGDRIVLLSTDHGETWVVKFRPAYALLTAVVVNSSQVVVGGNTADLFLSQIMTSTDRGDTWQDADIDCSLFCGFFADLYYRDGLFVATAHGLFSSGRAIVSTDGVTWTTMFSDDGAGLLAIVHDGSKYIVSGSNGAIFTSFDGLNWTKSQVPVADVDYLSGAWNGSKLVFAGGYSWRFYSRRNSPQYEVPVGISSADKGLTWDIFNIDGNYESRGMAFGNGRFVSVGQSAPVSGEGAIYSAEE